MNTAHRTRIALISSIVALAAAAAPAAASADTIYVSPSGSDSASGASASTPVQTLGQALKLARSGERVELAPGSYPLARDEATRTGDIEVAGTDSTSVAGLQIYGGQRLSFSEIKFTAPVAVQGHPIKHASQPASNVSFRSDEFATGGSCVTIREGATRDEHHRGGQPPARVLHGHRRPGQPLHVARHRDRP